MDQESFVGVHGRPVAPFLLRHMRSQSLPQSSPALTLQQTPPSPISTSPLELRPPIARFISMDQVDKVFASVFQRLSLEKKLAEKQTAGRLYRGGFARRPSSRRTSTPTVSTRAPADPGSQTDLGTLNGNAAPHSSWTSYFRHLFHRKGGHASGSGVQGSREASSSPEVNSGTTLLAYSRSATPTNSTPCTVTPIPEHPEELSHSLPLHHQPIPKATARHQRSATFSDLSDIFKDASKKEPAAPHAVTLPRRRSSVIQLPTTTNQAAGKVSSPHRRRLGWMPPSLPDLSLSTEVVHAQTRSGQLASTTTTVSPLRRNREKRVDRESQQAIGRSLLFKGILMHEYGLTLRAVLGQPPVGENNSHLAPAEFMNHQGADLALMHHFMLPGKLQVSAQERPRHSKNAAANDYDRSMHRRMATRIVELAASEQFHYPFAAYVYAKLLEHGYGCERDRERSHWMLEEAAILDEPLAMYECSKLPSLFAKTRSMWLKRAANHAVFPSADACYDLALVYLEEKEHGHGSTAPSARITTLPLLSTLHHLGSSGHRIGAKRKAAKYLRKCVFLGKSLPDTYLRWIFKKKYMEGGATS